MSSYSAWPFLSDPNHPFLSAVWAVLVHGCLGLVVLAPILWRSDHRAAYAVVSFFGGSAIDLDHFVAAGSFNLGTIETLSGRPDTHSLVFVLALALLTLVVTRRLLAAWALFAVTLAHLLFDAAGGGVHILYPLHHPDGLPWLVSPLGTLALLGVSAAIAAGLPRREPSNQRDTHLGDAVRVA